VEEAVVVGGEWNPSAMELQPRATYSLLRQGDSSSEIVLKGQALKDVSDSITQDTSQYGIWLDLPPGTPVIGNFVDTDGDGIDDRLQPGPGQPTPSKKSSDKSSVASSAGQHLHTPVHAAPQGTALESPKVSKKSKKALKSKKKKSKKKN
jgi:hypothetical protein